MNYQILLSGPKGGANVLRNALASSGFVGVVDTHDHGHPSGHLTTWEGDVDEEGNPVSGSGRMIPVEPTHPVAFTLCTGPDVDQATAIAGQYGAVLRGHWPEQAQSLFDPEVSMSVADRIARVESDLAILKAAGHGG